MLGVPMILLGWSKRLSSNWVDLMSSSTMLAGHDSRNLVISMTSVTRNGTRCAPFNSTNEQEQDRKRKMENEP